MTPIVLVLALLAGCPRGQASRVYCDGDVTVDNSGCVCRRFDGGVTPCEVSQ